MTARRPPARSRASDDVVGAMEEVRVIPVVTLDDAAHTIELTTALLAGGLRVVELTLRTAAGIEAVRVAATVPGAIVGAGSVTSAPAASDAIDAGARFLVAPGLDDGVVAVAVDAGVPVIPGVATPTELMRAMSLGLDVVKLFPAEAVGGPAMVEALAAVWPDVRFVPTGGITAASLGRYLALSPVLAVGGSWMVPRRAIAARDWASITAAARASVTAARSAGSSGEARHG